MVNVVKTYINSSPTFNLSLNVDQMPKKYKKHKVGINQVLNPDTIDKIENPDKCARIKKNRIIKDLELSRAK